MKTVTTIAVSAGFLLTYLFGGQFALSAWDGISSTCDNASPRYERVPTFCQMIGAAG